AVDDMRSGPKARGEIDPGRLDVGDQIAEAIDGDDRAVDARVPVRRRRVIEAHEVVDLRPELGERRAVRDRRRNGREAIAPMEGAAAVREEERFVFDGDGGDVTPSVSEGPGREGLR